MVALPSITRSKKKKDDNKRSWIGVEGIRYDIRTFDHPGGTKLLDEFANRDSTVHFLAMHHRKLLKRLDVLGTYRYETTPSSPGDALQAEWMELNDKFQRDGRYEPCVWFLYTRIGILLAFAVTMFMGIALYRSSTTNPTLQWTCLVTSSVSLAFIWQQSGFLMHDLQRKYETKTNGRTTILE